MIKHLNQSEPTQRTSLSWIWACLKKAFQATRLFSDDLVTHACHTRLQNRTKLKWIVHGQTKLDDRFNPIKLQLNIEGDDATKSVIKLSMKTTNWMTF